MSMFRFAMGRICMTPGVETVLASTGTDFMGLVQRHGMGDWGVVDADDAAANDAAVLDGDRIVSSYLVGTEKVWIITESDRSATTLLLPDEY